MGLLNSTFYPLTGTAEALRNAEKICIVPGYGLAVAQAASVVAEIALKLRKEGELECAFEML